MGYFQMLDAALGTKFMKIHRAVPVLLLAFSFLFARGGWHHERWRELAEERTHSREAQPSCANRDRSPRTTLRRQLSDADA